MDDNERLARNAESKQAANNDGQPWSLNEDELLQVMYSDEHTEDMLAEIAETLGRTIEACRQRYYTVQRSTRITYTTRTATTARGETRTVTNVTSKARPKWMDDDEEGSPWYV